MRSRGGNRWHWRFFEGAVSISASTWLAIGLNRCAACGEWPLLGFLSRLAGSETGIIITATALLFPTAALLYGGVFVFFSAKESAERWSRDRAAKRYAKMIAKGRKKGLEEGRQRGREEGREAGRQEVVALLKEHDVQLPPEVLNRLNGYDE